MKPKMIAMLILLVVSLGAMACSSIDTPAEAAGHNPVLPLVIRNGRVIDGTGAEPIPGGIVVIQGERIVAVGREGDIPVPPEAQFIDAQGGTILPGIIDSHVHDAWSPEVRRQFLEVGVTTVCDLGSPIERMGDYELDTWNDQPVARGLRAGPIVTAPGGLPGAVLGPGLNYEVGTPAEARRGVAELLDRGADVIKVYLDTTASNGPYPLLEEAVLEAIVNEAHDRGVSVRAHVTQLDLAPMALDYDVDVIEHVPERPLSEEWLVQVLMDSEDPLAELFDQYVVAEYDTLLPRMAAQEVVMVPTMARVVIQRYGPQEKDWQRVLVDGLLEIVRRFHRAGGVIALGTDYSPGVGEIQPNLFAQEAQLLHAAGLTPVEVIEAATNHAARVCGKGEDLGTIEAGKLADVLVLAGDPLKDLQALYSVSIVVKGGIVAYAPLVEE